MSVAVAEPSFVFKLYIAGPSFRSLAAADNLSRICQEGLAGDCAFEVIDVLTHPGRAEEDRVMVTPTLIRLRPGPELRLIGDLSRQDRVMRALGLPREGRDTEDSGEDSRDKRKDNDDGRGDASAQD